jgi:hypothetical protein
MKINENRRFDKNNCCLALQLFQTFSSCVPTVYLTGNYWVIKQWAYEKLVILILC